MKKVWIVLLIIIGAVSLVLTGCTVKSGVSDNAQGQTQQIKRGYTNISSADAKKRLDTEKGIILLDVRTKEEYAEKHIPGSTLIPVDVLEKEASTKLSDKDATIFVYCRSGNRSVAASEILVKLGYTKVFNLGGIINWNYKTESGEYKQ